MQIFGLNEVVFDLTKAGTTAKLRSGLVVQKHIDATAVTAKSLVRVDEGETRDSIGADVFAEGDNVVGEAGPTTPQAIYLENGTSKMPPYAFMGPALDRHSGDYEKDMQELAGDV